MAHHYPVFLAAPERDSRSLPTYVQQEFAAYLRYGRLEHGFLRVRCMACHAERLVPFSCKRRGFCPSCGARRMVETAALVPKPRTHLTRYHGVFGIEIDTCEQCGGWVKVIASIENRAAIRKVPGHLESRVSPAWSALHKCRVNVEIH